MERYITYDNKTNSFTDWSKETGLTTTTIRLRLKRGRTIGQALGYEPLTVMRQRGAICRFITYDGRTMNATDWARELNIPRDTLTSRLSYGWPVAQALGFEARPRQLRPCQERHITFRGVTRTMLDWAGRLGVCRDTLRQRLRDWPLERAMTQPPQSSQLITVNGVARTFREWSEHTGIKLCTIKKRIESGWSIEEAVTRPLKSVVDGCIYHPRRRSVSITVVEEIIIRICDWCTRRARNIGFACDYFGPTPPTPEEREFYRTRVRGYRRSRARSVKELERQAFIDSLPRKERDLLLKTVDEIIG